jgi:DNA-binding NtrC family response regulator
MEYSVIRLSTPVLDQAKNVLGYLTLSLDIVEIQRVMTLYSSRQSPLYIHPQEKERLRSFFFDATGWIICETGLTNASRTRVSIDDIRTGLQGDVGRPGFDGAFRPGPQYEKYWTVVSAVQAGKDGELDFSNILNDPNNSAREHFLYYAPIRFQEDAARSPVIIGGIGCVDGGYLLKSSRYEMSIALTMSWICALGLTIGALFCLNRRISRPIGSLTAAVQRSTLSGDSSTLDFASLPYELQDLQQAMNMLLQQLQAARSKAKFKQHQAYEEIQRQPVCLESAAEAGIADGRPMAVSLAPRLVGNSKALRALNVMIHKASQVMADVLIVGETGTGKELTAEAIHNASSRAKGPFISINCGALDENLLMDALFGHVKGAFSEARTERKGSFLAASSGTLHLDEIGNASPKVQQALLRALAARTIRPLGSDEDIQFDARVIAATNVDLLECSRNGTFREDLYYRLAVITIATPPLRERKEDIPALVRTFLSEAASSAGKTPPKLSWGALDKLLQHDWPGNIRELKNTVTRAMAFAGGRLLLAEHMVFGQGWPQPSETTAPTAPNSVPIAEAISAVRDAMSQKSRDTQSERKKGSQTGQKSKHLDETDDPRTRNLNHRQKKVWPSIVASGGTNRALYQSALGEEISVRTAQYDLQDMVNKGLLTKTGKGPSSRYVISNRFIS